MIKTRIPTTGPVSGSLFAGLPLLALGLVACEAIGDPAYDRPDVPANPGVMATSQYPSMQAPPQGYAQRDVRAADRPQPGASQQASPGRTSVPRAPDQTMPAYPSPYSDQWQQSQPDMRGGDIYVTDERGSMGAQRSGQAQYPAQNAPQPGYGNGAYGDPYAGQSYSGQSYSDRPYTDQSGMPAATRAPSPMGQQQGSPGAQPEIPAAPGSRDTGRDSGRYQPMSEARPQPQRTQPQTMPSAPRPAQNMPSQAMAASAGGYGIHLASYRAVEDAYRGWDVLTASHPGLTSLEPRISAVDIAGLGMHYRLKAGPFASVGAAEAACAQIEPAGDYCAVMPFDGQAF